MEVSCILNIFWNCGIQKPCRCRSLQACFSCSRTSSICEPVRNAGCSSGRIPAISSPVLILPSLVSFLPRVFPFPFFATLASRSVLFVLFRKRRMRKATWAGCEGNTLSEEDFHTNLGRKNTYLHAGNRKLWKKKNLCEGKQHVFWTCSIM